jgi:hypothetical protein
VRYAFIQASLEDSELKDIPIAKRCEVLEVSVSGYHAWVMRQRMPVKCKKVISDETVLRQAKIIRNEMKYTPGYRQMHALMRQRGVCIGVKRLRGVLRVNGIIGYRHFKRTVKTTDSNHNMFVYPNLLGRDFAPGTLNRTWVSDIILAHDPRMGILGYHFGSWEPPHSGLGHGYFDDDRFGP